MSKFKRQRRLMTRANKPPELIYVPTGDIGEATVNGQPTLWRGYAKDEIPSNEAEAWSEINGYDLAKDSKELATIIRTRHEHNWTQINFKGLRIICRDCGQRVDKPELRKCADQIEYNRNALTVETIELTILHLIEAPMPDFSEHKPPGYIPNNDGGYNLLTCRAG